MHYVTDYSSYGDDHMAKHNAAIADLKSHFGEPAFNNIVSELRKAPMTLDDLTNAMGIIAGISGYPVKALYNYCFGLAGPPPPTAGPRVPICRCPAESRQTEMDGVSGLPPDQSFEFCIGCGNPVQLETCIAMMRVNTTLGGQTNDR